MSGSRNAYGWGKRLAAAAVFAALYGAAAAVSEAAPFASFALLFTLGCLIYAYFLRGDGHLLTLPGLFGLFWYAGEGIACLKLSRLSAPWVWQTWVSFGLLWPAFVAGYRLCEAFIEHRRMHAIIPEAQGGVTITGEVRKKPGPTEEEIKAKAALSERRLRFVIAGLTAAATLAFVFEAFYVGFVPAFIRDTPHAYSYFHVSGVHYFTVSCTLVMPLCVLWALRYGKTASRKSRAVVAVSGAVAVLIPLLIVSRFFLIMGAGMALLTYLEERREESLKKTLRLAGLMVLALIPLYVLLTVFRAHSVEYLNGIFEMKNERMPIFITQPYMYVANNYENFNGLVTHLEGHYQYGLCQAFPLFALSGLKFVVPEMLSGIGAVGLTKVELTTLTIAYDAYHDFGIIGVGLLGAALGVFGAFLESRRLTDDNPAVVLAYAQTAMYLILSFFTTWFSNPTTWFWYVLVWLFYWFMKGKGRDKR